MRIDKFLPMRRGLKTVNMAFGFILHSQIWYRWEDNDFICLIPAFVYDFAQATLCKA